MRTRIVFAVCALTVVVATGVSTAGNANKTGQACYKGMYAYYKDPSTGKPFATEQACTSLVAKGGTLVPEVDVSVGFQYADANTVSVSIHNGGLVPAVIVTSINLSWTSVNPPASQTVSADCDPTIDGAGQPVTLTCSSTVQPGDTKDLLDLGVSGTVFPEVSGLAQAVSTYSDPNTSNNTGRFTLPSV
jgi:hypothetical protein